MKVLQIWTLQSSWKMANNLKYVNMRSLSHTSKVFSYPWNQDFQQNSKIHTLQNNTKPSTFHLSNILVAFKWQTCHLCQRNMSAKHKHFTNPLFLRAENYLERTALVDQHGSHTYQDILAMSNCLADQILEAVGTTGGDLKDAAVSFLCENDASYLVTQWAVWISGGVAVPLSKLHPPSELQYFIKDSGSKVLVCTEEYEHKLKSISSTLDLPLLVLGKEDYLTWEKDMEKKEVEVSSEQTQQQVRDNRHNQLLESNQFHKKPALIIYTSGTTGRPKGVVHTYGTLQAMITDMTIAWEWSPSDVILHVLPLHHVHGIVCILMTALYNGAACVMMTQFDARQVWYKLLNPNVPGLSRRITMFMAVPTIYAKLIADHEQRMPRGRRDRRSRDFVKAVCSHKIRLMTSGSAALPTPIASCWEEITGHRILERFGMSEMGMVLGNPLHGNRILGAVGQPFPKVEVCIVKPNVYAKNGYDLIARGIFRRTKVMPGCEGEQGELYVKCPGMFTEYLNRPDATKEAFTDDGWFKTGDTVCYKDGVYWILGRTSVDIIKNGGYKISALEVERHLLAHPDIKDVAVVGLPDVTWGQRVAAVVILEQGSSSSINDVKSLRSWALEHMAPYQAPTVVRFLENMPRNAMGKVNKKELVREVFADELKEQRY